MVEDFFDERPSKIKRAVIAGVAEALKQKTRNPKKSDQEIIQEVTKKVDDIIENID